jgi:hypothetical protein
MAPDIPKVDPDRHPDPGAAACNFRDEVLRWPFHANRLSDLKDLLIPFCGICHGRGRGFEPRRPRHTFQKTYGMIWRAFGNLVWPTSAVYSGPPLERYG